MIINKTRGMGAFAGPGLPRYVAFNTPRRGPRLGGISFSAFGDDGDFNPVNFDDSSGSISAVSPYGPYAAEYQYDPDQLSTTTNTSSNSTATGTPQSNPLTSSSFWSQAATGTANLATSIFKLFGGGGGTPQAGTAGGQAGISPMTILAIGAVGIGAYYLLKKKKQA